MIKPHAHIPIGKIKQNKTQKSLWKKEKSRLKDKPTETDAQNVTKTTKAQPLPMSHP